MAAFNKKKIISGVVLLALFVVIFFAGWFIGKSQSLPQVSNSGNVNLSLFWDAYNKLKQNYIDPAQITNQNVVYGAISGMTASMGDPFTEFFDPAQAKLFNSD